jgi:3-oxoacyl-(acyl-carrier-protein) synthase
MKRRVAITGIGLVTRSATMSLRRGTRCSRAAAAAPQLSLFDASGFPCRIAAEVKTNHDEQLDRKIRKFANRSHRFALAAAEQAFRDAGLRPTPETATRWGCAVGAGMMTSDWRPRGNVRPQRAADGELHVDRLLTDPAATDPMVFCRSQATAGISLLTRRYDIRGYATSVHTACASGGQALGTAMKLIRLRAPWIARLPVVSIR